MNATEWRETVRALGCVVCRRFGYTGTPVAAHHVATGSGKRSPWALVPLCYEHHQGGAGLHGMGSKAFCRLYRPPGDEEMGLLIWTLEDIAKSL